MSRPYREVSEGTFVVSIESIPVALKVDPPLVFARVQIGPVPKSNEVDLYRHLLTLNASALVHSAYGLDGDTIVLAAALELENLDYNELDAVFAEIDLALVQQLPKIRELAGPAQS
jgi:hypothetical protein